MNPQFFTYIGGGIMAPPCQFLAYTGKNISPYQNVSALNIISHDYFPLVSPAQFWYSQIYPGGTYGTTFMVQ